MMLQPDFVALVMQLFFENEFDPSDRDVASVFESILDCLIDCCYYEIAVRYSDFVSVLPVDVLGVSAICKILPSQTRTSEFWKKIEAIATQGGIRDSVVTNLEKQEQVYKSVIIELLTDFNLADKGLAICKQAIEKHNLVDSQCIKQLAVECL